MNELLLGKNSSYDTTYNPDILTPVPRQITRTEIGIDSTLPFKGVDIWNAWEVSWLNSKGKPLVACARFQYSADSEYLVESKSFKLYLNSLNQTRFNTSDELQKLLQKDLSAVVGKPVEVVLYGAEDQWPGLAVDSGTCLDNLDISIDTYTLSSELLAGAADKKKAKVSEQLYSHLFKSNCMVTGQPDWASIQIEYSGNPIDHSALLRYLISFRDHQAFHEPCAEKVFVDLMKYCQPDELSVYCRYTRRGGLDINPYRSTSDKIPSNLRLWRQ